MVRLSFSWISTFLFALSSLAAAQQKALTLDILYDPDRRVDFSGSLPEIRWLKDGKHYLQIQTDPVSQTAEWLKVDLETGSSTPFYDPEKLEAALASVTGVSPEEAHALARESSYLVSPGEDSLLMTAAEDLFLYREAAGHYLLTRLTLDPGREREPGFSPDGRYVSFVRNNNLHVVETETNEERALTADGSPEILNGILDWVYQEEIYGRGHFKAYWWSPDSTQLAFLQLNESPVPEFTLVDHIPYRPSLEAYRYPKAGDPNPKVRLGMVPVTGGEVRWVDLSKYENEDILIVRVSWKPAITGPEPAETEHEEEPEPGPEEESEEQDEQEEAEQRPQEGQQETEAVEPAATSPARLVYQVQDRRQTWLDLNLADPKTGKSSTVLRETSPAWVNVHGDPHWLSDGSFLWLGEQTGWKHLYHYAEDGTLIQQLTSGSWEARELHGVDEESGYIYISGTKRSAIGKDAYQLKLDGSELTCITEVAGFHETVFNSTLTYFVDMWSNIRTPPQLHLFRADGTLFRTIDRNDVEALAEYRLAYPELLQVSTGDGFPMEALLLKPVDFDPSKKYPVWVHVYGGPHAQLVQDRWRGRNYMWYQLLAQRGFIIWVCDNRIASGKSAESTWKVHRNFGELELRDLEDSLEWLKQQPWVDGSRIGLGGWSFGGYLTAYALTHSQSFRVGVAGGSVTDWRDYDSIYTERYMSTPEENPEGYRKSSAVAAAENLHGELLLIHGTLDDNVHMQNTLQLAYALQKAGKPFELMLYPKSKHRVRDPHLNKHVRALMLSFIEKHLRPEEQPIATSP
ncbi:MAG: S9 family peptidase [Acidobacteriota bacterium]